MASGGRWKKAVQRVVSGVWVAAEFGAGPTVSVAPPEDPTPEPKTKASAVKVLDLKSTPPLRPAGPDNDPDHGDPPDRDALGIRRKRLNPSRSKDELQEGITERERGDTPAVSDRKRSLPEDSELTLRQKQIAEWVAASAEQFPKNLPDPQTVEDHRNVHREVATSFDPVAYKVFTAAELRKLDKVVTGNKRAAFKDVSDVRRFTSPGARPTEQHGIDAQSLLAHAFQPATEFLTHARKGPVNLGDSHRTLIGVQSTAASIVSKLFVGLESNAFTTPTPLTLHEAIPAVVMGKTPPLPGMEPDRGLDR